MTNMQKRIIQIIAICLGFSQGIYAATEPSSLSDCPGVILCTSGDNSKRTLTAYEEDQRAYQCYSRFGDTQMSKIAGQAMTNCQTMYGSINPTIRKK
jgi:hypothetical protein